jgi:hypothetical protein
LLEGGAQPRGLLCAAALEPLRARCPPGYPVVHPGPVANALSGGHREEGLLSFSC